MKVSKNNTKLLVNKTDTIITLLIYFNTSKSNCVKIIYKK